MAAGHVVRLVFQEGAADDYRYRMEGLCLKRLFVVLCSVT